MSDGGAGRRPAGTSTVRRGGLLRGGGASARGGCSGAGAARDAAAGRGAGGSAPGLAARCAAAAAPRSPVPCTACTVHCPESTAPSAAARGRRGWAGRAGAPAAGVGMPSVTVVPSTAVTVAFCSSAWVGLLRSRTWVMTSGQTRRSAAASMPGAGAPGRRRGLRRAARARARAGSGGSLLGRPGVPGRRGARPAGGSRGGVARRRRPAPRHGGRRPVGGRDDGGVELAGARGLGLVGPLRRPAKRAPPARRPHGAARRADREAPLDALEALDHRRVGRRRGGQEHARADELEQQARRGRPAHLGRARCAPARRGGRAPAGPRRWAWSTIRSISSAGTSTRPRSPASGTAWTRIRSRRRWSRSAAKRRGSCPASTRRSTAPNTAGPSSGAEGVDDVVEDRDVGDPEQADRARVGDALVAGAGEQLVEHRERVARGPAAGAHHERVDGRLDRTPSSAQMRSSRPRSVLGGSRRNG